jgi:hypothetical protein
MQHNNEEARKQRYVGAKLFEIAGFAAEKLCAKFMPELHPQGSFQAAKIRRPA